MRASCLALLLVASASCDDGSDKSGYDVARPAVVLHGVGATVAKPLFAKWAEQYALVDPSTTVVYDAAGSGAGVKAAIGSGSTADFGVSDSPLSDTDSAEHRDVVHLPAAVEAIALVYSLAGLGPTRLQATPDVVADMLAGGILWWEDRLVAADNPGVKLPHVAVRPAYRGDQSGSSYLLSEWLSKTSKKWHDPPTRSLVLPAGLAGMQEDGIVP